MRKTPRNQQSGSNLSEVEDLNLYGRAAELHPDVITEQILPVFGTVGWDLLLNFDVATILLCHLLCAGSLLVSVRREWYTVIQLAIGAICRSFLIARQLSRLIWSSAIQFHETS
jgi:hypothetical protein